MVPAPKISAKCLVWCGFLTVAGCSDGAVHDLVQVERASPVAVAAPDGGASELDAPDAPAATDSGAPPDTTAPDIVGPRVLPLVVEGDTRASSRDVWDRYACAPDTDESGPEDVFTFTVDRLGLLRARLDDVAGDASDVDVHLLASEDPSTCVRRDNTRLAWVVRPGTWTIVVDTWVDGDGQERAGAYRLEVELMPLDAGPCAVADAPQRMFWSACAPGVDCRDEAGERRLATPSLGPVVHEAHLVTTGESFAGDGWPTALRDQIERHYAISEAASGYVMARDGDWAPEGEGGSHWGGGATGQKLPATDEAWYVNMYWRDRPARGRRMLVVEPWSGRAVVAAGGWETGPGSNTAIGGACEEIHHHLGTAHRDDLVMGFLLDEAATLGPITGGCWP